MSFPESVLLKDEKVVERFGPHKIVIAEPVFSFIIVGLIIGAALVFLPKHLNLHGQSLTITTLVLLGAWLLIGGTRLAVKMIRWRCTIYVFTNHRVITRVGVFSRSGRDISLERIADVGYNQSFLDRLIGAGTLIIESSGEHGTDSLNQVPNADRLHGVLSRLVDEAHTSRGLSNQET